MQVATQNHIQMIKTWFANWLAECKPVQELQYLGEKLWQLK
jgi:hypothetical protein